MKPVHASAREPLSPGMTLALAGDCYRVSGMPGEWAASLPPKLMQYRTDGFNPPHAAAHEIDLSLRADESLRPSGSHDLHEVTRLEFAPHELQFRSAWCAGTLRLGDALRFSLHCHPDGHPWFGGQLENVLRIMVAYAVLRRGGLLLHSAAMVRDSHGFVLIGHSGAGKSTCSRLARRAGWQVLSDDINVLLPSEGAWRVVRVPFCGTEGGTGAAAAHYPVSAVLHLSKHHENMIESLSAAQAVLAVCASAPFINQDRHRAGLMMQNAEALAGAVNTGRLYFSKDAQFLDLMARLNPPR